jgi:spermidine/putrescine transport system permease protein
VTRSPSGHPAPAGPRQPSGSDSPSSQATPEALPPQPTVPRPASSAPGGGSPWLLLAPLASYGLMFVVAPLVLVALCSLCISNPDGRPAWGPSLGSYRTVWDPRYLAVLLRSVRYASSATLITLLLAWPLAWFVAMHGGKHKHRWLLLVMLPFWTSYLIRVYAWKTILSSHGLLNTLLLDLHLIAEPLQLLNTEAAVVLGLVYGFLPFMMLPLFVSIDKLDRSLLDAARDLGATPREVLTEVVLPLCLPGIFGGCLLTFIPALGDFVTPDLLGGPSHIMIGNLIESKFLPEMDWPVGSALACTLMSLLMLGVVAQSYLGRGEEGAPP